MIKELVAYVLGDNTMSNLIGTRLYPNKVMQDSALPCLVYQLITEVESIKAHDGVLLRQLRIQFTAWADSYADAHAIYTRLRQLFDGYRGGLDSSTIVVEEAYVDVGNDLFDPETFTPAVVSDIIFLFKEK